MAKQKPKQGKSKSTTVDLKDGRILKNNNGAFSVTQDGKRVKPTNMDSTMYNSAVKSGNAMQTASFKKPLLSDPLKKKKR